MLDEHERALRLNSVACSDGAATSFVRIGQRKQEHIPFTTAGLWSKKKNFSEEVPGFRGLGFRAYRV